MPYKYGEFLAKIHKVGTVLEEDFAESGTRIVAYLPPSLRNKLQAPARPPLPRRSDPAPATARSPGAVP